jgi:hypothetical protein
MGMGTRLATPASSLPAAAPWDTHGGWERERARRGTLGGIEIVGEGIGQWALRKADIRLIIFDPEQEEIVRWIQ